MKKAETKKKKAEGEYTLEVSVNDVEYKASGASMLEVLSGFVASADFPVGVKTRVLMKFSDGKKKGMQAHGASMARKLFNIMSNKPSAVEILASKMEQRMA